MNKRHFLKTVCGYGLCSCAAGVFGKGLSDDNKEDPELAILKDSNWRLEWRLNHAKRQMATIVEMIEPELDDSIRRHILETMGRNCARSLGWAKKYKGNPEGFFEHMQNHSGEKLSFNKSKNIITIISKERDCDCSLVDSSKMPGCYCDCSLGWQKETYETILGKSVEVEVKESVLRGSKRCVFEVTIA